MGNLTRREALGALAAAAAATAATAKSAFGARTSAALLDTHAQPEFQPAARINQSVCRWCYRAIPLEDLCASAKAMGFRSVELLSETDWAIARKHGLECAMSNSFGSIEVGFNRLEHHDKLVVDGERLIPLAAAAGVSKIVVFSGNRAGLRDAEGIANCVSGLRRLMPTAERHRVTLCMEMLNSKVDHKDYHADHTAWAVKVVDGVGSPRFRLLYDIYHMQVMEGDVIATIRAHKEHIAHFHTGGVPGRNEIDDTQELNYRRVMRAIADLGYTGFVGQEFIPKRDPLTSLRQAFGICDI
jgi:hydroxypyruvate isomerase